MATVLLYSRHRRTQWWRYILSQVDFARDVFVISEFRHDGDSYIMPEFYRHLKNPKIANAALEAFGPDTCNEIAARCRFLRTRDRGEAMRMIGAMVNTLTPVIEAVDPDVAISFCVDYYAVDIAERLLRFRRVPFVGISAAVIDNFAIVTARGEHNEVREPSDHEVDEAVQSIASSSFAPYLPHDPRYGVGHFLRMYLYYRAREAAIAVIRRVERDPLNFHYLLAKPELGCRVRLADRSVSRYLQSDWEKMLDATSFDRRVFLPLPVYPESTIDYWIRDISFLPYDDVLEDVARTLADSGYIVFVKDHPNMFGFRHRELFERLARIDGIVFVPYHIPAQFLVAACKAAFTFGGTVGLQTALAGRLAILVDSYYFLEGAFYRVPDRESIARLPGVVDRFVPPDDLDIYRRRLVRHMLRTCIPGNAFTSWRTFDSDNVQSVEQFRSLIQSLNTYLPGFVNGGRGIDTGRAKS